MLRLATKMLVILLNLLRDELKKRVLVTAITKTFSYSRKNKTVIV